MSRLKRGIDFVSRQSIWLIRLKMRNKVISAVVTAAVLGISPAAFAGEGGIAGSASFSLDRSGGVRDVAVASAIGKTTAVAGAVADPFAGVYEAYAVGTGGQVNLDTDFFDIKIKEEDKKGLEVAQVNEISALGIGPIQLSPNPLDSFFTP